MSMRLEEIAPHVAEKIKTASRDQQLKVVQLACRFAMNAAPIQEPVVIHALSALGRNEVLNDEQVASLNGLMQQLDDTYFDLQDLSEDDPEKQVDALRYFGKARALSALLFSQDPDALVAAMESVYEASATTDQPADLFEAVMRLIS
ncbi:hypothetical protein [Ralstonia solanacearum]|uniref:hypothetical protein n=1 Tax=Ralstonia solanacearum TaxID=305 RepID=UPI00130169E9|nr:hypothetical protein [Ralstonia solanacearum]